jgi:hypothetical protein
LEVILGPSPKYYKAHRSEWFQRKMDSRGTKSRDSIRDTGERGKASGDQDITLSRDPVVDLGMIEEGISEEGDITFNNGDKGAMRDNKINT